MIEIKVNGKTVNAPDGGNLLIFLNEELGLNIPHFCFHPALISVGSCRMCQVEFISHRKNPAGEEVAVRNLGITCRQAITKGLEVETHSPAACEARRAAMEFQLANHPLDCPICDQAGECKLQDYAEQVGQDTGRMSEPKRLDKKLNSLGDVITHDRERCVLCTRCVRLFETLSGKPQMGVINRGDRSYTGTFFDTPLTGNYQGCLTDVCPVGSLTLKKFRFKQRAWNLTATPSICPLCSRGCNIFIDTGRDDTVYRIRPRRQDEINKFWICDQGRLEFDELNLDEKRLTRARIHRGDQAVDTSMSEALKAAAALLKEAGDDVVALASPFMTVEEGKAFATLFAKARVRGFWAPNTDKEAVDLLHTDDPCPNRRGLEAAGLDALNSEVILKEIPQAKVVYLAGERLRSLLPQTINSAWQKALVIFQGRTLAGVEEAVVALPALSWAEKRGTFINVDGKAQTLTPALPPPGEARADLEILRALHNLLNPEKEETK